MLLRKRGREVHLACEEAGRKCPCTKKRSGIEIARSVEENLYKVRRGSVISGCL